MPSTHLPVQPRVLVLPPFPVAIPGPTRLREMQQCWGSSALQTNTARHYCLLGELAGAEDTEHFTCPLERGWEGDAGLRAWFFPWCGQVQWWAGKHVLLWCLCFSKACVMLCGRLGSTPAVTRWLVRRGAWSTEPWFIDRACVGE